MYSGSIVVLCCRMVVTEITILWLVRHFCVGGLSWKLHLKGRDRMVLSGTFRSFRDSDKHSVAVVDVVATKSNADKRDVHP